MASIRTLGSIGFIGAGIMGKGMCRNLMKAGHALNIHSRTKTKAEDLLAEGAVWFDDTAALAEASDAVITIVGYPKDVEEVYFGSGGVLSKARPGTLLIDMTTSNPSLAVRIAEAAGARGLHALDAPVSGGDVGARDGTLAIMAGGSEEAFKAAVPLFEAMGKTIRLMGPPGSGQHTKMVNQIIVAGTMLGVAEGMAYAEKAGLDPEAVLSVVSTGAARGFLLETLGPKMAAGDFAPGFFVHHFIKDMGIALEEAKRMRAQLPALSLAREQYTRVAEEKGGAEDGTQALIKAYRDND